MGAVRNSHRTTCLPFVRSDPPPEPEPWEILPALGLHPPQTTAVPAICVLNGTNGEWIR
jgi:hypothetical protein